MDIQDAYSAWSDTYDLDRNLTRDLDQVVTRQVLAGVRCRAVLEIGCGTGKNTPFLAQIGERVLCLDLSPGMLQQAKTKTHLGHVSFALADLGRPWPCPAGFAGLVACSLVLEHLQELGFIFSEAARALASGGLFYISELHPFRQYQGKQAVLQRGQETIAIPAFIHHISDFTAAADENGFSLVRLREWWHAADQGKPPRLVTFLFEKRR